MSDEDIFYLFTQAMELKWQDTVEAIYDLTKFCIATENYEIWEEIFNFTKEKAQQIIDCDNEYDKKDIIQAFENDRWITDYIIDAKKEEELFIDGILYINGMKYDNISRIIITYNRVILYDKNKQIGSIKRHMIISAQIHYDKCHNIKAINDILKFNIKENGNFGG